MEFSNIKVNVHQFASVLSLNNRRVFEIPKYQREYTWGVKEWEDLFDDLIGNNKGYFLGSIICINTSTDEMDIQKYEIVDGQQRLTTLSILLAALYTVLKQYEEHLEKLQQQLVQQIENRLVSMGSKSEIRVIPQTQNNNHDDYMWLLSKIGVVSKRSKPQNAGNRRIIKAYKHFVKRIKDKLNPNPDNDNINRLFEILKKVNSAILVMIIVPTRAEAYILFQSLNNRGTPLSSVDLIKNLLLAQLEEYGEDSIDNYYSRWKEILNNLGEEDSERERFFRQNYNAFRKTLNERFNPSSNGERKYPLGILATRSTVLDIYEAIIKKDPVAALDELYSNAEIYASILLHNNTENLSDEQQEAYKDLKRVQGAPSYLLIMYLIKKQEELGMTDRDIVNVCNLLVNFFIRRNLTDQPPTRDLTQIFMSFIESIEQKKYRGADIYTNLRKTLISVSASDDDFKKKLYGSVYADNRDATRFILCMMAKKGMTHETKDLWEKDKKSKKYVWSIEHIFPQGPNIPRDWVNMIADGDNEKAKELQKRYVHTFGNLTITGYNGALSNKPFDEKKNLSDNGHYIGYRNGLNLNEDVCDKDEWTVEIIRARTDRMVKEIMEMFAL